MTPVRTAASGLGLLLVPVLLFSARTAERPAATEPPAPTVPPSTVPATIATVEPTTTTASPAAPSTTTAPVTTRPGGDGDASTPPGIWVDCITPWGDIEPAWCDPRVRLWIRSDGSCWVTPAGVERGAVCPDHTTTTVGRLLPETAAGSRWA